MLLCGLLEGISTQADTMYSKCQHEFKKPQKHSVLGVGLSEENHANTHKISFS